MRAILCFGGPDRKIVDETGKEWRFEMHPYCGPMPLTKTGEPMKTEPSPKSSFWRVVTWWAQQGQQIDAGGLCVWQRPRQPKMIHLGGNHYQVVTEDAAQEPQ